MTIFGDEEVEIICNIPISNYLQEDKLIWYATSSGEFLVKSAYYTEKELQERKKGEGSNWLGGQEV